MKKFTAILLALLVVFSTSAVAFAADIYTCPDCGKKYDSIDDYNKCIDSHDAPEAEQEEIYECDTCHKKFDNIADYNECVDSHFGNKDFYYDRYVNLTIVELINSIIDMFNNIGAKDLFSSIFEKFFSVLDTVLDGGFVEVEA